MLRKVAIAQGFEPTYEELKDGNGKNLIFNLVRFEPTYEELKGKV